MTFILGVGRKTARQPHGGFTANFFIFYPTVRHPKWFRINSGMFQFWKNPKSRENITWDYSRVPQFPVFRSRPEVENMTMHSFRVNSISTKFHPNQPTGDAHHVTKTSCFLAQKFWGISWHLPDLYSGIPCSKEFKGAWKSKLQIIQNHSWVPREIFQVLLKSICHFEIISKRVRYP